MLDKQILLIVDYTHSKALVVKYTSEAITIKFILDKVKKNQSEAAKILGMNRGTLKKKIELYKL
jgi:Fis family transcriptional regulator